MYLINYPSKKSFCNNDHYWRLRFKQGTNEPYVVCAYCDHAEMIHLDCELAVEVKE